MKQTSAFHRIGQLGFVVTDEEKAFRMWADGLGVGPWEVTRIASASNAFESRHYGKEMEYDIHASMCFLDNIELEYISCSDQNHDSTYWDYLEKKPVGLQHLGMRHQWPFRQMLDTFARTGAQLAHSAVLDGREPCVYADLQPKVGTLFELNERGGDFGPPPILAKYPPDGVRQDGPFSLQHPFVKKITAAAFVVDDIERAVRTWADDYGVGPWAFILRDESSVDHVIYQGRPVRQRAICAVCKAFPELQLRLYQPLDGDESLFTDHLAKYGSSALYLYTDVALPFDEALDYCAKLTGRQTTQTCRLDAGQKLAFADFNDSIGVYLGFGSLLPGVSQIPKSPYYKFYPEQAD